MQLAADNNMQIVQPTSASQIFHVLRRQMVRMFRKPLVIMTPKSLLRNKDATSPLSEFTKGEFRTVLGEQLASIDAGKVRRLIVCSGKVYYDLVKKREEKKANDVAIARVEQLYPFPHKAFAAEMKRYPNATEVVWCQDEPQNQGPGSSSSTTSTRTFWTDSAWAMPVVPLRRRQRLATRTCIRSNRRRCSTRRTASSKASC